MSEGVIVLAKGVVTPEIGWRSSFAGKVSMTKVVMQDTRSSEYVVFRIRRTGHHDMEYSVKVDFLLQIPDGFKVWYHGFAKERFHIFVTKCVVYRPHNNVFQVRRTQIPSHGQKKQLFGRICVEYS